MLNNVPTGINRLTRNVVMNHPNSWGCQVFRKEVLRQSESSMGGIPTLGGLGVLDSEDEEDFKYCHLGDGYCLVAEPFSAASMMDRQDANNGATPEVRFLIEPEEPSGMPKYFDVKKHDLVYIVLADDVKLAHEVVDVETLVNIFPFTTRYVVNRRSDLDVIGS